MTKDLGKIATLPKTGAEPLTFKDRDTGLKLLDFWQWSVSDIISNATRGKFAEFIVAAALKIDLKSVRDEWSAYDLISPEGIKVEVKSAAYLQSWHQRDFSKISFSIKPAREWDATTGNQSGTAIRSSDVYVFCLLKHQDQKTLNPMNLDQWEFYVISTENLNILRPGARSISLKALMNLVLPVSYDRLRQAVIHF